MARHSRKRTTPIERSLWWRLLPVVLPTFLLPALLAGAYYHISQPGRMPLRVIEVTGEFTYLDQADIEHRVAKAIDGGFLDLDLQKLQKSVRAMPWVDQVSVRRAWPDSLRMYVTEQVPLAYWNSDAMVNLDGEVFRPQSLPGLGGLPHLYGSDANAPAVVAFYLQLHARLLSGGLRVERVELNQRNEWKVEFRKGLVLMLGREDIAIRQQIFLDIYPQLLAHMRREAERIDMRYEHGFAVRWREATGDS